MLRFTDFYSVSCWADMESERTLAAHLEMYGIRHFPTEEYYEWAPKMLGDQSRRVAKFMTDLDENPDAVDKQEFYDYIARPNIAPAVHSFKADALRASGCRISQKLRGRRSILDLGCNIGYLTAWYAISGPERQVTGVDFSRRSIREARKHATRLGVNNVTFIECDLNTSFPPGMYDAIVDSQTLTYVRDRERVLCAIKSALAPGGLFASIPATGTAAECKEFMTSLRSAGLEVTSLEFVCFTDVGDTAAYPVLVCDSAAAPGPVDCDALYEFIQAFLMSGVECDDASSEERGISEDDIKETVV